MRFRNYVAHPTIAEFHKSIKDYRLIIGPVGSGKSSAMCVELFRRSCEQRVAHGTNLRKFKFAIVRNTFREIRDTTLKTWQYWFGDLPVSYKITELTHFIHAPLQDGTFLHGEVLFRALDTEDDVRKLLSLELTGAWMNECREIRKTIVDALYDRVGRYPSIEEGGCTWSGIIGDTNPPDTESWLYQFAEVDCPENYGIFKQPGGLIETSTGKFEANPLAENTENLEPDYYTKRIEGRSIDHIRVYYCAKYGFLTDGMAVIPEYHGHLHNRETKYNPHLALYVGVDFGLTPAATIAQRKTNGAWVVLGEITTDRMGAERFGLALRSHLRETYPDISLDSLRMFGDPAGNSPAQTDERTPFDILQNLGFPIQPAPTNEWVPRRESIALCLTRIIDGEPGLVVNGNTCPRTHKGLLGAYCLRKLKVSGLDRYSMKPEKNIYSHPVESLMYLLCGAGEMRGIGSGRNWMVQDGDLDRLRLSNSSPWTQESEAKLTRILGLFIDETAGKTAVCRRVGLRQQGEILYLPFVDPEAITDWVDRQLSKDRVPPHILLAGTSQASKIMEGLRRYEIHYLHVFGSAGKHRSPVDAYLYRLKQWLSLEVKLEDGRLLDDLSASYSESDAKGIISYVSTLALKSLAITLYYQDLELDRTPLRMKAPSAMVR
jgi:terminase large subunit-like protein